MQPYPKLIAVSSRIKRLRNEVILAEHASVVVARTKARKQTTTSAASLFFVLLICMTIQSNWELVHRSDGFMSSRAQEGEEAPLSYSMLKEKRKTQHYYLHIPKVGGYAMQGFLSRNGAWVLNVGLGAPTRRQPIAKDFATWANDNPNRSIIMSEGVGFNNPKSATTQRQHKSFVMFRNPQTHVLSQYFHCAESQDHRKRIKKARLMRRTSLLEWLQYWEGIRQNTSLIQQQQSTDGPYMHHWTDERYNCYNPVNLQSWITGSYAASQQELQSKFDGIGILSQFHLSGCVFLTTNLKHVVDACNCTGMTAQDNMAQDHSFLAEQSSTNIATTHAAASIVSTTNSSDDDNGTHKTHAFHDHGVAHHGDSYQPSHDELQLIRNLTRYDQMLYDTAAQILQAQVAKLQEQYHVTFCKTSPPPAVA